jgi:hypothetical protein
VSKLISPASETRPGKADRKMANIETTPEIERMGSLARHDANMARKKKQSAAADGWVCGGCGERFESGPQRADHQRNPCGCATLMRA